MSYDSERLKVGREKRSQCVLELDYCSNDYGVSPCTASEATGLECYNTRATCQDPSNYSKTTKSYKFCSNEGRLEDEDTSIPIMVSDPKFVPTEIRPDKGLSVRSTVTVEVADISHHDRGFDPYVDTRTEAAQGLFFARLLARNPYHRKRLMRVNTGYLTTDLSETLVTEDDEERVTEDGLPRVTESNTTGQPEFKYKTRLYAISKIEGPIVSDTRIIYKIHGKDLLDFAAGGSAQVPTPSTGKLNASIDSSVTSLVLAAGYLAVDFPTGGGIIAIGDEWASYTARSGSTISGMSRGGHGTEASSHSVGDSVQYVQQFSGSPVDVIYEIIDEHTDIDASTYITSGDWTAEETYWFSGINLAAKIGVPTDASKLIDEICEAFQIDMWFDDVDQKIKLKANVPPLGNESVVELDDGQHLVAGKTKVKDLPDKRVSRVSFRYGKINHADSDRASNFSRHHYNIESDAEDADGYDEVKAKTILSKWLNAAEDSIVVQSTQRLLDRFSATPKQVTFQVDAKDSTLELGGLVDITTDYVQNASGAPRTIRYQVIKAREVIQGHTIEYTGLSQGTFFSARNGFIASNSMSTYSAASASERLANAFVGPNIGLFNDGTEPYKII